MISSREIAIWVISLARVVGEPMSTSPCADSCAQKLLVGQARLDGHLLDDLEVPEQEAAGGGPWTDSCSRLNGLDAPRSTTLRLASSPP